MITMDKTSILEKIEKLLALAGNNPSESEAQAALAKARELMAKHNIAEAELTGTTASEPLKESVSSVKIATEWKRRLAELVAEHFRCKHFYYTFKKSHKVVFFGFESDSKVAATIFEYLAKYVNRKAGNYVQRFTSKQLPTLGIKNDYISGFMSGLKQVWEAQNAQWKGQMSDNQYALVVVTPKEVTDAYSELSKGFKTAKWNTSMIHRGDVGAITAGYNDGKAYAESIGKALDGE